jgi:uncharacterized phage protein gp47/JayE
MPYGLTSTGFNRKTLAIIKSEIEEAVRTASAFGTDTDTSAESVIGQLVGIFANQLSIGWETLEAVYNARSPNGATSAALDNLCALTGVVRLPATKGTVMLTVRLNAGVTLPAGSIARVAGQPSNRWVTAIDVTNTGGSAANYTVSAEAETAGRILANAGTITEIAVPVSGWVSVTNASDATPGRDLESDTALRTRRNRVIRAGGSSPLDAIRAALLAVTDVQQVNVYENDTDYTANGLPPHSVHAVVTGGTDQAVGEALFAAKAAGIATHGATSVTVTDDGGNSHTVLFDRPATVNIYVMVTLEKDASYAGDDAVKTAVASLGDELSAGDNVRQSAIVRLVLAVMGVVDVTEVLIGRAGGASRVDANLLIGQDEIAAFSTARVQVTANEVTP